jgi:hypothetical protein
MKNSEASMCRINIKMLNGIHTESKKPYMTHTHRRQSTMPLMHTDIEMKLTGWLLTGGFYPYAQ